MTPIEIAYFKHFMYDKMLERSYQYYYRKNRVLGSLKGDKDGNPESIEQFFLQTSAKDVILKAFTFYPSGGAYREDSTFDYWKKIDDQWQQYISSMSGNAINDSWPMLRRTFAILRQNWDVPFYWQKENYESTEEVYKRMHINLPLPEFCWSHGCQPPQRSDAELIKYSIHDAKDGDFVVRTRRFENGGIGRTTFIIKEVVTYDPDTSEFLPNQLHCNYDPEKKNVHIAYLHAAYNQMSADFRTTLTAGRQIHAVINDDSEITKYRLAFEGEINAMTEKLAENGLAWNPDRKEVVPLSEAMDEKEDAPEIDFVEFDKNRRVFNALTRGIMSVNTRSHSWRVIINRTDTKDIKKKQVKYAMVGNTKSGETMLMFCNNSKGIPIIYNSDGYYNVNSRQFCDHLKRLLSFSDDLAYLCIEKVSEKIDSITYKVTKQ